MVRKIVGSTNYRTAQVFGLNGVVVAHTTASPALSASVYLTDKSIQLDFPCFHCIIQWEQLRGCLSSCLHIYRF